MVFRAAESHLISMRGGDLTDANEKKEQHNTQTTNDSADR